ITASPSACLPRSASMSGNPTSAVLPRPAESTTAPMRARDQPSHFPTAAKSTQAPPKTSHMATGKNHNCGSIRTCGTSSSTSAVNAMLSTHQLSEGASVGGGRANRATSHPSARQEIRSSREPVLTRTTGVRRESREQPREQGPAAALVPVLAGDAQPVLAGNAAQDLKIAIRGEPRDADSPWYCEAAQLCVPERGNVSAGCERQERPCDERIREGAGIAVARIEKHDAEPWEHCDG